MKIRNDLQHLCYRLLALAALFCAAIPICARAAPASEMISGRAADGPCPKSMTFIAKDGRSFEVDVRRVRLPVGQEITVTGQVYPKASLCKRFAWIDVSNWKATSGVPAPVAPVKAAAVAEGEITVSMAESMVLGRLQALERIAAVPATRKVQLLISPGTDARTLPTIAMQILSYYPNLAKKFTISVVENPKTYTWGAQGRTLSFNTYEELQNAIVGP